MTVTTILIASFVFLVIMGLILGLRKPASYDSDTVSPYYGMSKHGRFQKRS